MIRFWMRELMGWLLVFLGLFIFYVCIALLLSRPPAPEFLLEAPILSFIGVMIFRGGIHLLKVAVAARIAMHPPIEIPKVPLTEKRHRATAAPLDW